MAPGACFEYAPRYVEPASVGKACVCVWGGGGLRACVCVCACVHASKMNDRAKHLMLYTHLLIKTRKPLQRGFLNVHASP
jgi:hypothetical protein